MPRIRGPVRLLAALAGGIVVLAGCASPATDSAPVNSEGSGAPAAAPAPCATPLADPVAYDPAKNHYSRCDSVTLDGQVFVANHWANAGECPIEAQCAGTYAASAWRAPDDFDITGVAKPIAYKPGSEFYYYQSYSKDGLTGYEALMEPVTQAKPCSISDYSIAHVKADLYKRITSGDMKDLVTDTPEHLTYAQRFASANDIPDWMAAEAMLPCYPSDPTAAPNVKNVMKWLSKSTWDSWTKTIGDGDATNSYPVNPAFKEDSYTPFLRAVARYPYFCKDDNETCGRELAMMIAHMAQETSNHTPNVPLLDELFSALRENGGGRALPNHGGKAYNNGSSDCPAPLDCMPALVGSEAPAADDTTAYTGLYYGRGPFQLSYPYNYAPFSAQVLGADNVDYLLKWPDLVGYSPDLQFLAALWYFMTPQPPKPSMYEVSTGLYKPDGSCATAADCFGVMTDKTGAVANPFEVSIEVQNGALECRAGTDNAMAKNRAAAYLDALEAFGITPTADEASKVGCDNIRANSASGGGKTLFAEEALKDKASEWVAFAGGCLLTSTGAGQIAVTVPGVDQLCAK